MPPTISVLERQLEQIRRNHLAKYRSSLRGLTPAQLQGVQLATAAITEGILTMALREATCSTEEQRNETLKALSLLFQLGDDSARESQHR